MTETQKCNVCNIEKELTCFSFRNDIGKYRKHCKKCKPLKKEEKVPPTTKVCKTCNNELSVSKFSYNNKSLNANCKSCVTKIRHDRISKDRDGYLAKKT